MLKAAGCFVIYLKRVATGNVLLDDDLGSGAFRTLTEEELAVLGACP